MGDKASLKIKLESNFYKTQNYIDVRRFDALFLQSVFLSNKCMDCSNYPVYI